MINNIQNNKAYAKKKINELNKIKKVETKGKRLIDSQKTLLSLFDNLKTIFNNNNDNNDNNSNNNSNNNNNESNSKNESENEGEYESESESENKNEKDEYYYEKEAIK